MRVIDADAHVMESVHAWQYLDAAFHLRRPIPITLPSDTIWGEYNSCWLIDDKMRQVGATPTTAELALKKGISIPSQELTDVTARLGDLDRLGIEKQVIYPSLWLACLAEDVELEIALAKSYNKFMSTQCNQSGGRLYYSAIIPFRRPSAAVEEVRRVRQMGAAVSIFVRGMEWDTPISHPSFYPIYEEAERQDLAIALHLGFGSPTIQRMFEGIPWPEGEPHLSFFPPYSRSLISTLLVQFGFISIMEGGLMDDFPNLRVVILEGGSEWIPSAMEFTNHWTKRNCQKYFEQGRVFVTCEPDEDLLHLANKIGVDCFVAGSDMPHMDAARHDQMDEVFKRHENLANRFLEKVLWENPSRLYGI